MDVRSASYTKHVIETDVAGLFPFFFLMQRQGHFTPGLWLRPGAVALGGWGRRAEAAGALGASLPLPGGAPRRGRGVRGHSQDTASSARGALPAERRDCAEPPPGPQHPLLGGRGSRAWTRHPVSPCQSPGPPAPRQGLWVLCPLGPPEPAPLGLSTLEEGGSPTPGCRPPQLLLQDQGTHPSDASLPHTARN